MPNTFANGWISYILCTRFLAEREGGKVDGSILFPADVESLFLALQSREDKVINVNKLKYICRQSSFEVYKEY